MADVEFLGLEFNADDNISKAARQANKELAKLLSTAMALNTVLDDKNSVEYAQSIGKMSVAAKDVATELKRLNAEMKEFSRIQKDFVKNFDSLRKATSGATNSIEEYQRAQKEAREEIERYEREQRESLSTARDLARTNGQLAFSFAELNQDAQSATQSLDKMGNESRETSLETRRLQENQQDLVATMEQIRFIADRLDDSIDGVGESSKSASDRVKQLSVAIATLRAYEDLGRGLRDFGASVQEAGRAMTAFITLPIAGFLTGSVVAANEFESAFTGVIKTVDGLVITGSIDELNTQGKLLRDAFLNMSQVIPVAATELAKIGEISGQLGVPAKELADFSRVIAEFSESTDVELEDAAKSFAQLASIFQVDDISEYTERTSNAIVDLGNNFATTESEILSFFQTFSGSAAAFGVTTEDALGLATAFKSVRAQTASSASGIQKTLTQMASAVVAGGDTLRLFAEISGKTEQEFVDTWESRPGRAFADFISGLGRAGDKAPGLLKQLGLGDIRIIREFLKVAAASDVMEKALTKASEAYGKIGAEGARAIEASRRFATFQSQLELLRNDFTRLGIEVGSVLLPIAEDFINAFRPVIQELSDFARNNPATTELITQFALLTATLGPTVVAIGSFLGAAGLAVQGVAALSKAIAFLQLTSQSFTAALSVMAGGTSTVTTGAGTATVAVAGLGVSMGTIAIAGASLAAVFAALAVSAYNTAQAIDSINQAADIAKTINELDAQVKETNILIAQAASSYGDYISAMELAGLSTNAFTEDQFNVAKGMNGTTEILDELTAGLQAYKEETNNNWFGSFFQNDTKVGQELIALTNESRQSLEGYRQGLLDVKATMEQVSDSEIEASLDGQGFLDVIEQQIKRGSSLQDAFDFTASLTSQDNLVVRLGAMSNLLGEIDKYEFGAMLSQAGTEAQQLEFIMAALETRFNSTDTTFTKFIRDLEIMNGGPLNETQIKLAAILREGGGLEYVFSQIKIDPINNLENSISLVNQRLEEYQSISEAGLKKNDENIVSVNGLIAAYQELLGSNIEDFATNLFAVRDAQDALNKSSSQFVADNLFSGLDRFEDDAFDFKALLGLITEEQAEAGKQITKYTQELDKLAFVLKDSGLTLEQQVAAVELLRLGYASTAEGAIELATSQEQIPELVISAAQAIRDQTDALIENKEAAQEAAESMQQIVDAQKQVAKSATDAGLAISKAIFNDEKIKQTISGGDFKLSLEFEDAEEQLEKLNELYSQTAVDILTAGRDIEEAALVDLKLDFGLIPPEQAEFEQQIISTIEALTTAFGVVKVDDVLVDVGAQVRQMDNPDELVQQITTAVQSGADVNEAIEIVVAASAKYELENLPDIISDVTALLNESPETSAVDAAKEVLLPVIPTVAIDPSFDPAAAQAELDSLLSEYGGLSGFGEEAEPRILELQVQLQEYENVSTQLELLGNSVSEVTGEEAYQITFNTNISGEAGVLPEVQQLEAAINLVPENNVINYDYSSVTAAKNEVDLLKSSATDVEATITYNVRTNGTPPSSFAGSGNTPAQENYHGGLVNGKAGKDAILSRITKGEYIMPNYIVRQPAVLKLLSALHTHGSKVLTSPALSSRFFNTSNKIYDGAALPSAPKIINKILGLNKSDVKSAMATGVTPKSDNSSGSGYSYYYNQVSSDNSTHRSFVFNNYYGNTKRRASAREYAISSNLIAGAR